MHSSIDPRKSLGIDNFHVPKTVSIAEYAIIEIFDHNREKRRKKSMWCRGALISPNQRIYKLDARHFWEVNFV